MRRAAMRLTAQYGTDDLIKKTIIGAHRLSRMTLERFPQSILDREANLLLTRLTAMEMLSEHDARADRELYEFRQEQAALQEEIDAQEAGDPDPFEPPF
jgi:hypothetical protein